MISYSKSWKIANFRITLRSPSAYTHLGPRKRLQKCIRHTKIWWAKILFFSCCQFFFDFLLIQKSWKPENHEISWKSMKILDFHWFLPILVIQGSWLLVARQEREAITKTEKCCPGTPQAFQRPETHQECYRQCLRTILVALGGSKPNFDPSSKQCIF